MNRSACLIFNPVAGQGNPELELDQIRGLLEPEIDLDIYLTTVEIDADELAYAAINRGVDCIIASGGDGTLSAVAEAVVNSNIPLGIISRGTANAFASALGIPNNIVIACQTILQGITRTIDVASCNDKIMILLVGIGFEADTIERTGREAKNRFGMLAYILAGIQELGNLQKFEVEIETEDKIITTSASSVTVANAAPATSVLAQGPAGINFDDGLLDLTIVAPENRAGAIAATFHLFQTAATETPVERNDIGYLRAKEFKITTNPPQKVVVDGEIIGTTPVEIKCIPKALTVFVPSLEEKIPIEKLQGLPDLNVEIKQ
ncbi:YegS/Rv2252/BmrU family lipid kinase [Cronbergia sp. UHCC 0137]|uniref:YegS/Rv2252/BmrU family lipid kinase n=1 Tax=Cronbergia sp. UHCC 0137 TaxID=3110239 RepID=UPI002B2071A5|nr:YegS/Rv2252/BmrU family lipid kinase [Cronbergia sp. UHCC 0137]MEA5618407.1 YegS/Rv2252/BmrU family lipid kinase [Cronbergia sp. UHCC 0137]